MAFLDNRQCNRPHLWPEINCGWQRATSFSGEPDSASAAYDRVITNYPSSSRIPTALYRLGLISEQKKDRAAARQYYNRLVTGYPRSEEASLARDKLQALGR